MDAAVADFQAQCVAPLAAGACPVMAADAAGLARIDPPPGSGPGVMAWRTPSGGMLLIDAYATGVCRVILPGIAAPSQLPPATNLTIFSEPTVDGRTALRAELLD